MQRFVCKILAICLLPASLTWGECRCFSRTPLDLVLILDASDSMGDKIHLVKGEMSDILKVLRQNCAELRVGQVSYGRTLLAGNLTSDSKTIQARLDALETFGNFEPVDLALEKALAMDWSPAARKVILLIGDEPPDNHDRINAVEKSYALAAEAHERGIIVHTVSALDPKTPLPEFVEIARRGGGEAVLFPGLPDLGRALSQLALGRPINWGEEIALPPQEHVAPVQGSILIQKLVAGSNWDLDPDDLTRLLLAAAEKLGRQYSWQTILPTAEVEEYEKGRIVFISAHGKLDLPPETWARLHDFVARGGFILADACCNDRDFDASFREEMARHFPDHPLRKIPPGNAVYHSVREIPPENQVLWGIQYECRTAVIYSPFDLSCRWAKGGIRGEARISEETAYALGLNILQYIVRYTRLVSEASAPIEQSGRLGRKIVAVGQVIFQGNWNPPTQTLESVLSGLSKSAATSVLTQRHAIHLSDERLYDYPMLFLTGHGEIGLSDEEVQRLKSYLDGGGFLFANACCGDRAFDASFRQLVKRLGRGMRLVQIPAGENVLTIPNVLSEVALTRSAHRPEPTKGQVLLEGVRMKDRWVIVYSPHDATAGLLENPCSLCDAYTETDARRILTNVLTYGLTK